MRVLLAEDEALLREGLTALLERAGHAVAAVGTATELEHQAHRLVTEEELDLVITDVRMPPDDTDDGIRAAAALRAQHPRLPVVILSQYITHRYATALLGDNAGDDDGTGGGSGRSAPAAGVGYLLKDRVAHVHDFLQALETVHSGGIVVDPAVIRSLMGQRPDRLSSLSPREAEVLALVSEGSTNQQIAASLHLSEGAVVKHISAVFDKLSLTDHDGNRRVLAALTYLQSRAG